MATEKKPILTKKINSTPTSDKEPEKVKPCPTPAEVDIKFAPGVKINAVSPFSLLVLKDVLSKACIKKATISSTARSNYGQAKAMYTNIKKVGLKKQKALYPRGSGAEALKVYEKNKNSKDVVQMMANRLEELDPMPHVRDQDVTNVIDIAPSSIPPKSHKDLNREAAKHPEVTYFIPYPKDPAFHFEIDQYESVDEDE